MKDSKYWLERLRSLRDDWSDDIPPGLLTSITQRRYFKVRRIWWQALELTLKGVLRSGGIRSSEISQAVNEFRSRYFSERFQKQPLTTAEDINRANEIINLVLKDAGWE